ncbi:MAG TPA: hypothetical protein DDZ80_07730 [Cyanobacteria bacterium UBA8803]|nr:hypothetical protein [Cyanobacteria bacterium UBA9273]HBL58398.1 hypothetical protein [Cyanobacteria bacterium UBA8803]
MYRDLPVEPGHQQWVKVIESTPNLIGVEKGVGDRVSPPPILQDLDRVSVADLILEADGKIVGFESPIYRRDEGEGII